jgi:hypothetical protein
MCSITDATPAPVTVPALAALVKHAHEVNTAVAAALGSDPALLAAVPDALLESMALELHAAVDTATAAATVVTGRVDRQIGDVQGLLIGGVHPSTRRWLEVEAGLSPHAAKAMVGRGRDLVTHATRVADAWLAGDIPAGAVRPLTLGVSEVLRRSKVHDLVAARSTALDSLLPIAGDRDVHRLQQEVTRLRFLIDPDGCTGAALHAWERQSLSILEQGGMLHVSGTLPLDSGAAVLTVLDQRARRIAAEQVGPLTHDSTCATAADPGQECTCGEADRARRAAGLGWGHLTARAFTEVMREVLDNGRAGSHHRVAPHVTVITDLTDSTAPLIGELALPGTDHDTLIPEATLRRLLCDADITRVVTTTLHPPRTHLQCRRPGRLLGGAGRRRPRRSQVGPPRRPRRAHRHRTPPAGAGGPRPALRVPRLPRPRGALRSPPRAPVGGPRPDRPAQHGDPLRRAPPRRARRRLDHAPARRLHRPRARLLGLRTTTPRPPTTPVLTSRAHHRHRRPDATPRLGRPALPQRRRDRQHSSGRAGTLRGAQVR